MGTRSITRVYEIEDKTTKAALRKLKPVLTLYRQYDGYPSGMGADIGNFIHDMTIVNGFGNGENAGTHANGAGCFAAQLVKYLKEGIGGVYIYPPSAEDQSYNYHIYLRARDNWAKPPLDYLIIVRVTDWQKKEIFYGTRDEYVAWIVAESTKEE